MAPIAWGSVTYFTGGIASPRLSNTAFRGVVYRTAFRGVNAFLDSTACRCASIPLVPKTSSRFITGEIWRRARTRLKVTQKRAAAIVGVDEKTVQKWEGGQIKKVRRLYLDKLRAEYLTGE